MKTYGGVEVTLHFFLPRYFLEVSGQLKAAAAVLLGGKSPRYPLDRLGGPLVCLDAVEKRQILHYRESNPGRPSRSPSLYRLSYADSTLKGYGGILV
jgi:hypothetical protein